MGVRTGADYIHALRDEREVWHAGRRIDDVTAHSGFAGTIKTLGDIVAGNSGISLENHHHQAQGGLTGPALP